jgi:hypothetical protein
MAVATGALTGNVRDFRQSLWAKLLVFWYNQVREAVIIL